MGNTSPDSSIAARPALKRVHSKGAFSASNTLIVAAVISGPMPSPSISVAGILLILSPPVLIIMTENSCLIGTLY
jgi:hypothetical protein